VKSRLVVRFGIALCLGAAAILIAAAVWNVSLQREHLTGLLTTSASQSADLVRFALRDAMLENEPERMQQLLNVLGEEEGVERIRIFDKDGRILHSTDREELGRLVDTKAEQCIGCHRSGWVLDQLAPERRVREFHDPSGHGILAVTTPIPNEADCSSAPCHVHPAERRVLGVLDVQLHLDPVEHHIAASQRQMAATLGLTALCLVALSAFLTWQFVIRPVRDLTLATRRVAEGDLETRVPVRRDDEIGELGSSWNATIARLGATKAELDELVRTLEDRVEEKTEELTQAHDQMLHVEKMASLGKLAAVVAHEVNNPLAGIATYARLLHRRFLRKATVDTNGETARILQLVESEAARCGDIVRNLLLFSRTPGRLFAEADLRTLLERCVLLFGHQADLQEVQVDLHVADDLPPLICDASQIQQLVLALSMNAIEAMTDGGELKIRAARDGEDTIVLTIEDSGAGIDEAELPHVFEPFYTTKPEGKGVGLGLAVVYGIARRHGGTVSVWSQVGEGTRFVVRLPLDPPPENEDATHLLEGVIS
jgi:two-component system NtrC family sensor kinase